MTKTKEQLIVEGYTVEYYRRIGGWLIGAPGVPDISRYFNRGEGYDSKEEAWKELLDREYEVSANNSDE